MHKAKRNIITTLIGHVVATICGMVIPGIMISSFGSTMYGLSASVAQFLSYISLLDGGVARVARAELYGSLAEKNDYAISKVYYAIKRFFAIIGIVFLVFTCGMSLLYYDIADVSEVSRDYVFCLVWIISAGTLAKYMGGISNLTLLNADQKQYVGNIIVTVGTMCNALMVVILVNLGCDLLAVKIGSSIVYIAQPICYSVYVKKHYKLQSVGKDISKLPQKWTGLGQHVAYFLHTNTDIVILTVFADLRYVAVYSVYRLVISSIRKITSSFTSGMEAAFGELIAKKQPGLLQSLFLKYKHMLSFVSIVLFGTTAILVVPFVQLYTSGVTDADYTQPMFAIIMIFAEAIDCFMHPCSSLPISANKLKETRWGSYGEAIINVGLSLALVWWNPLIGVALATLLATVFKSVFYMVYAERNILLMPAKKLLKSFLFTIGLLGAFAIAGVLIAGRIDMDSYLIWALWGVGTVIATTAVTVIVYYLVYPEEMKKIATTILRKIKH